MSKLRKTQGFTLIEMMVTLALVVIMLSLAVPSLTQYRRNSTLSATANAFLGSINTAKAEAMRQGKPVFMMPTDGKDWRSGWVLFIDANFDGQKQDSETILAQQDAIASDIQIPTDKVQAFADASGPYLAIGGNGYPRSKSGSMLSGAIDFAYQDSSNLIRRRVNLGLSGQAQVCDSTNTDC